MKTYIYTVGYDSQFRTSCNTGWGCGYCMIPKGHPILNLIDAEYGYLQVPGFDEEITYSEWGKLDGEDFYVIGFDTAHIYNNEKHNFDYVLSQTIKMQQLIDNYHDTI